MGIWGRAGGAVSLSLVVLLVAYCYRSYTDKILKDRLDTVLNGLLRAERKVGLETRTKVAVGFGACLDGFANATELLEKLGAVPPKTPEHFSSIANKEEFEKVFAYFFRHGAAGERYTDNKTMFEEIVYHLQQMPSTRWEVGGNAPVMARRFSKEGCEVLLGANVSPRLLEILKPDMKVAGDQLEDDDIHVLLEYKVGAEWGDIYRSPRANRFIIHSDQTNPTLRALEDFTVEMQQFSPDLLVVGGLQMMDNFPFKEGERRGRLQKLQQLMASVSMKTRVHFEMASFSDVDLVKDLVEYVLPYADSLGMNEQELPNLQTLLSNGSVTLISDPYPRIATVLDQMRAIYDILNKTPEVNGQRKLTRLHVHTLAYQAILTTKGSAWKNTMSAAAKASLTAHRHVCGAQNIDLEKTKMIMDESFSTSRENGKRIPVTNHRPVSCWDEEDHRICIAPGLVCTQVYQTGGGGDNVSSAGLVLQV